MPLSLLAIETGVSQLFVVLYVTVVHAEACEALTLATSHLERRAEHLIRLLFDDWAGLLIFDIIHLNILGGLNILI